jgi:hypothetical protein
MVDHQTQRSKTNLAPQHGLWQLAKFSRQTLRHAGLPASTNSKRTGAIPKSAMTAGSLAVLFTPS